MTNILHAVHVKWSWIHVAVHIPQRQMSCCFADATILGLWLKLTHLVSILCVSFKVWEMDHWVKRHTAVPMDSRKVARGAKAKYYRAFQVSSFCCTEVDQALLVPPSCSLSRLLPFHSSLATHENCYVALIEFEATWFTRLKSICRAGCYKRDNPARKHFALAWLCF